MIKKIKENRSGNEGFYSISGGIPKGVYSDDEIEKLRAAHPHINIDKFLGIEAPSPITKNRIVEIGKKELLNIVFESGGVAFNQMAIGDGGYDFSVGSKIFPQNSDVELRHQISTPTEITSFSQVTGDSITGFVKVLAATFFSEDFSEADFKAQNQTDFFVNEVGVMTANGILYSLLSFNNYPFDPKNQQALTVQWYIRSL